MSKDIKAAFIKYSIKSRKLAINKNKGNISREIKINENSRTEK